MSNLNVRELDPPTHSYQFDTNYWKIWYVSEPLQKCIVFQKIAQKGKSLFNDKFTKHKLWYITRYGSKNLLDTPSSQSTTLWWKPNKNFFGGGREGVCLLDICLVSQISCFSYMMFSFCYFFIYFIFVYLKQCVGSTNTSPM